MLSLKRIIGLSFVVLLVSCEDGGNTSSVQEPDAARLVFSPVDATSQSTDSNIPLLSWDQEVDMPPDMSREELCALVPPNDTEEYCLCNPQCCDRQRWYCPPNPRQTIDVMEVIVEICDENKVPCVYGRDDQCPPPEILHQGDCLTQWECPPGTSGEFIEWFECQLEDGTLGRQQVFCNKGNLLHMPCRPCNPEECNGEDDDCDGGTDEGRFPCQTACGEGWGFCVEQQVVDCNAAQPAEERCNFEDDDCDGEIDEGQRNACDQCGPLLLDICDGDDNDCDGSVDEDLIRECETICGRGLETCDGGNWISCTAQQPVDEECDGEDNDCDGTIDEQLECLCTRADVGNLMPCFEPPLLCGQGFKTCECIDENCTEMRMTDCAALCSYLPQDPAARPCNPLLGIALQREECNNFDEDCDELVDEGLTQACYTAAPETLFVGVCVPGEVYCDRGTWGNDRNNQFEPGFCLGEVTPQEEICDGADNDCDGVVDYGEEIRETDILFVVDWSGSMDQEIEAVKIALNRFATHFAAEEPLQWGLIVGPKEAPRGSDDELLVLVSDIAPFDQFLASFAALGNEGMDTGSEMLLDAVYLAVRNISAAAALDIASTVWWRNTGSVPEKENFLINWRPNSERILIVFSDEDEQSYLRDAEDPEGPFRPITKAVVQDAVRAAINLKVYAFSSGGGFGNIPNHWESLTLAGNGNLFDLTSNAVSMYNDLMSIIDEACLPRQANAADAQGSFFYESSRKYIYTSGAGQNRYDRALGLCL